MSSFTVRVADWQIDNSAVRSIRETVFIQEQHVPIELEWDQFDENCLHLLAFDATNRPIGTARLLQDGHIGRMAVLKEWRGCSVGTTLLKHLLREAKMRGLAIAIVNAQTYAVDFYARFGFQSKGDEFLDAGIPHVRMVLQLGEQAD
jgi:predicted GNAT family N-acyltransferase